MFESEIVGEISTRRHAHRNCSPTHEFAFRLSLRRGWSCEHALRQDALGQVVDAGKVGAATSRSHLADEEQILECGLGFIPVPPRSLLGGASRDVPRGDRTVIGDALQRATHECLVLVVERGESPVTSATRPCSVHLPAKERVKIDVQVCRGVAPILEYLTLLRRLRDRRSIVCPEPGEQRQLLTAHEDVHRVDLNDAKSREDVDNMSLRGR